MEKSKQPTTHNIELHTFPTRHTNSPDIEEYHEISDDNVDEQISTEKKVFDKPTLKSPNEYDFFTKKYTKTDSKKSGNGKTSQKKISNLMDVINAEIESSIVPITDTIITKTEHNVELQKSYLMKTPRNILIRIPSKCFRSDKLKTTSLSPIFPKILDNAIERGEEIHVEYMEPVLFEDLVAKNANPVTNSKTKFLDIEIRNVKFQHHHEYSLEKLLTDNLIDYFNRYEQIKKSLHEISREIRINRETKENLKKDLLKISIRKDDLRFDQTVRQYTGKLLYSKEKQKNFLKAEKDVKHKIMSLWSDIEMLREKTKVTLTPYIAEITTTVLDDTKYEQEWNDKFDSEFADMLYKLEFEYVNKYLEYKDAKNEQKLQGVEKKKLVKPKLQIDDNAIRVDVEYILNNLIRKEIVQVALKKNDNILTQIPDTNKVLQFHFEIYVDDIFVCESEHYSNADENFNVEFAESFSVEIVPNNQQLTIVLFENEDRVSCVDVRLIDIKDNFTNSKLTTVNFVYDRVQKANSKTVGCGNNIKEIAGANKVRLKSSNIFKDTLYTNCDVQFKIGWQQTTETQSETLKNSLELGNKIKSLMNGTEKPRVDVLKDIIGKIYDRDVSNDENLTNTLNRIINSKLKNDDDFPIDENSPDFVRFQLLHLRNIGGFNNIDDKAIPLHSSQITTEQLNCLQREKERNFDLNYLSDKQIDMDPIEIQRFVGAKYVQKINRNILRHLNDHLMRKTHKDVVRDFDLRSLLTKPSTQATVTLSSNSKNQLLKESLSKEQEIQINAMRAFNLLDRSLVDDENCEKIAGFKVRTLRPFVRVGYHGVSAQTCSAVGCHPTWNHTLRINCKLEPLSTLHINIYDETKETITDSYSDNDDDQRSRTVHYRYYNKWLGTVQIPLYTVLSLGSLKGVFKITTPPTIFGYETIQNKEANSLIPDINQIMKKDVSYLALSISTSLSKLGGLYNYNLPLEDDYIIKHLNNHINKYANDFPHRNLVLTYIDTSGKNKCVTQYLQPIPLPSREFFPKNPKSCESALSKSSGFSKSSSSKSSGTRRAVGIESACRDWKDGPTSEVINACLRYVALIPTYDVTDTHGVTLTGVELLKVSHGSPIDHTILLASYFLQIGIKCWIASGLGLPRGLTTYVLIQYDLTLHRFVQATDHLFKSKGFLNRSDGYLWYVFDAVSGERYELRDAGCPLKTVHFVFDEENIWVNIQSSQDTESVSFDLSRSSDWEPVFDNSIFVVKIPAVIDNRFYSAPPNVETLRLLIESKIKTKVQKWRPHMKTIWNRYCSGVLRDTLTHWEYWAFNQTESKPTPSHKLKQLMVTYKIFGFPLNMPFVNTKSVISTVKSTSLHVNADPNMEFGLGVEVFSYPNNVLSVWVFFASISRV